MQCEVKELCDKVKNGLNCCKHFVYDCGNCRYNDVPGERDTICVEKMHSDALTLIETLEKNQTETGQ